MISWIKDIGTNLASYHRNREAQKELMAMTDRELADIGVRRCMIREIVWSSDGRL